MVYNPNQDEDYGSKLLFDLRQKYANRIDQYFYLILLYKETKNYTDWFRTLKLMKPLVLGRVTRNLTTTKENYNILVSKAAAIAQQYQSDYFGNTKTEKGIWEIEEALLDLEYFIVYTMEKNGFWGSGNEDRGL